MQNALIGYTGFVGGNLMRQMPFSALYSSKTISQIRGRSFDLLVFSGAQAKKWWANANPEADWAGIESALSPLRSVRAKRAVLISTIDVLPFRPGVDESCDTGGDSAHAYGAHRLRLEREMSEIFDGLLIVRLPALFGRGLKKNVIFDLLHGNMLEKIQPESRFQYYDLDRLAGDIATAERAALELVHLFPEPLATRDILTAYFPDAVVGSTADPPITYDFRTRHASLYGGPDGYLYGRQEVMDRLGAFLRSETLADQT